ncbi:MAG TPA: amino acid adenylation domain-containing protein [Alphaproteobacteria bacterium]|nr:amino acid adenylation domain-containing protein [Alphaproteobacteria bacterium]
MSYILAFAGDTVHALRDTIERARQTMRQERHVSYAAVVTPLNQERGDGERRVALTTADATEAERKLSRVLGALDAADHAPLRGLGIAICTRPAPQTGVAVLFPGQGGQYANMLTELATAYPLILEIFGEADDIFRSISGRPLTPSFMVAPEQEAAFYQDDATIHASVMVVNYALFRLLESLGVRASVLLGQSAGEYAALVASGMWSLETALVAIYKRTLRVLAIPNQRGGRMATVNCDPLGLQALARGLHSVAVASFNAPQRLTICGNVDALESLHDRCVAEGIDFALLPVSHAYHSELLEEAVPRLQNDLERLPVLPARIPVLSSVDGIYYRPEVTSGFLAHHLARQLTVPVEFARHVKRLYAAGYSTFVECGPRASLSGFVEEILADQPHVACASVHPKIGEVEQFHRLLATLYAFGYLDPSGLAAFGLAEMPARRVEIARDESQAPLAVECAGRGPTAWETRTNRAATALTANVVVAADLGISTPRVEIEKKLTGLWSQVLGIDPVGVEDDFFALGGHSLRATQLISRIRTAFGVELPPRTLFEKSTIRELADLIAAAWQSQETAKAPPLVPVSRRGDIPLSFSQERLWFLDQLEPGSTSYNIPRALRLEGHLDHATLDRALSEIVRRHEALRTTFSGIEGRAVQVIAPPSPIRLWVEDLVDLPEAERLAEAQCLATEEAKQPFDLARPLFCVRLLRLHERDHVLLLTVHHIVSDGWSMGVLVRELTALYRAFLEGKPPPLAELPVQYADFSAWQRSWLSGEVLESQMAYWKTQLAGALTLLELPTDRPRPAVQMGRGAHRPFILSKPLSDALASLSHREGVTLFMTLLTAYTAVLWRYTGQEKIVVGSPIANRNHVAIEGLIGFSANTLALVIEVSGELSFLEMLGRVREVCLGAYSHQDLPFEKLVAEVAPERSRSHNPLFQVMLVFQNTPEGVLELPGLMISPLEVETGTAKCDLSMFVWESQDGIAGYIEFNSDLFDPETIDRFVGHFQTLLEGVVARPETSIATLPLLTEAERHELVVEWNDTARDFPRELCLHELIEQQVERTPDAVAVVDGRAEFTYGELNRRANQLAHRLRALGVGPDVLVGVLVERSVEMVVALLGVLKAGGAYVPLDPSYPMERMAFMLSDSAAPVLITQSNLLEIVPNRGSRLLLDEEAGSLALESITNPESGVTPDHRAYVIYTSGSTGKPKGVQITHRNLVSFLTSIRDEPGLEARDVLLAVTTLSFDIAGVEIFLPLIVGAKIVVASREEASDGERLLERLISTRPTVMQATPVTWRLLLAAGWKGSDRLKIFCGGEAIPRDLATMLIERSASLWNIYGPTETTIWSTTHRIRSTTGPVLIGRPLPNEQVYILDSLLQPVPVGVPGELWIGGLGLARGYLNRPDLTAEKFVADPFSQRPGARIYRSGDLARYLRDGTIECLGRIDNQVKVRGFRIELGEIEAALVKHPSVEQAVVLAREDVPGDKRLVGYVVLRDSDDGQTPSNRELTSELRRFLQEELPDPMVPATFVTLQAFPRTPNGKIDRRALPPPEIPKLEVAGVAPTTSLEALLAGVWAEVLQVDHVGVQDNFFNLGGHSLLAVQLMARLRERFGWELPVSTLIEDGTIAYLAAVLRREKQVASSSECAVPLCTTGSRPPIFCVHSITAEIFSYRLLAREFGDDQPVYAFQARGIDLDQEPLAQIELMAETYLKEVKRIEPNGPYRLVGHSLGGVIAFEMAQQLREYGAEVELLAIVDSRFRRRPGEGNLKAEGVDEATLALQVLRLDPPWRPDEVLDSEERLNRILVRARGGGARGARAYLAHSDLAVARQYLRVLIANQRAWLDYVPRTYDGRATLFRARDGRVDPAEWTAVCTDLEIVDVPGDHFTLLEEPHVRDLAREISARLGQDRRGLPIHTRSVLAR